MELCPISVRYNFEDLAISGKLQFTFCIRSEKAQRLLHPISRSSLFDLKLATFLQPLEVLHRHNVYYLKSLLIILIYCVTFRDLLFEKSIMKVENVRNLRCFTNRNDF